MPTASAGRTESPVEEVVVSGKMRSFNKTTTMNPLGKQQGKVLPTPELVSKVKEMEKNRARRAMLGNWISLTTGHRLDTGSDKVRARLRTRTHIPFRLRRKKLIFFSWRDPFPCTS